MPDDDNMFDLDLDDIIPGEAAEETEDDDILADDTPAEEEETEEEGESEEEESEEEPAEEEEPDDEWPKTIGGRSYANQDAIDKALEAALLHIDSTAKETRAPLPEPKGSPLTAGGDFNARFATLPANEQAVLTSAWEKAKEDDWAPLEKLAMQVFSDQDAYAYLGHDLSMHIYETWANAHPRQAWAMEQAYAQQAQAALEPETAVDPGVQKLVDQQRDRDVESILADKIPDYTPELATELGQFVNDHLDVYDFSEIDRNSADELADVLEQMYYTMLGQKAAGQWQPATPAKATKKRRANKSAANTPVKGGTAPVEDEDDFLTAIVNADSGFKLFN